MYKHTFYYFLGNKKYPEIYILHIYSKWWGAAGLFKTWKYGKSEFSDNISQSQVLPEVDRSHLRCHLQPPRLPTQLELLPHRLWGGVLWRWGGWLRLQCGGGVQRSLISKFCLNYVIALLSRLKSLSMGRSGVVWQEGQSSCKFQSLP